MWKMAIAVTIGLLAATCLFSMGMASEPMVEMADGWKIPPNPGLKNILTWNVFTYGGHEYLVFSYTRGGGVSAVHSASCPAEAGEAANRVQGQPVDMRHSLDLIAPYYRGPFLTNPPIPDREQR